jgi:hypothetical protein
MLKVVSIMPDVNPSNETSYLDHLNEKFESLGGVGKNYTPYKSSGDGLDAMKKWLGPKGYKAFIQNLCQSISTQIQADQKKAQTAADKLKAVEEDRDPDDIPDE